MWNEMKKLILASGSPRRRELLEQIGVPFEVVVSDLEEKITTEIPEQVVRELSGQKAVAVAGKLMEERPGEYRKLCILGADTVVACEGKILGKPADRAQALEMLQLLSGRTHQVYTGVALAGFQGTAVQMLSSFTECTEVTFAEMSAEEIEEYIGTGDCFDKAGGYGIQGFCARYITGIRGDYNNVVGLPVCRVYQELKRLL